MNLARAFHRRRHGTGYSNGNAVTFTGVSGALDRPAVPDAGASPATFLVYFGDINKQGLPLADLDQFTTAVDRWGAAVVAGYFDSNVQLAAEVALNKLVGMYAAEDAYAKLMLDQAAQTLASARQSASRQQGVGPAVVAGAAGGIGMGTIVVVGIGIYFLLSKK